MVTLLLSAVTGCVDSSSLIKTSLSACEIGDRAMIRDTLYFGRNRSDGGRVRDTEWRDFLNDFVTPRFPDGLTVTRATGQWRGASGRIEREASEVATVLHSGNPTARVKIPEIVAEYRQRFHQEAVLRERTAICARF
jgi:Protein of unknown function (DUF3574)